MEEDSVDERPTFSGGGSVRISRLQTANYRGLPDLDLAVRDHLVLLGPSEAGKSSLLRLVHALLGLPHSQLAPSFALRDFTNVDLPVKVQVTFTDLTDEDRAAFPDEIRIADDEHLLRLRLEIHIDPNDPDTRTVRRYCPDLGADQQVARTQLDAIGWRYANANRSLQHELGPATSGMLRSLLNRIELGDDIDPLVVAIEQFHEALKDAASLQQFREGLAAGIVRALPRQLSPDAIRLLTGADPQNAPLADVLVHLVDDHDTVAPLLEQSDGLRSIALLTLFGLRAAGAQVVGIDEPELHLHPRARTAVGRLLAKSDVQQIVATHSGSLAAPFGPASTVAVSRVRPCRQLAEDHAAQSPVFGTRWWRNDLVETLTASHVVIVEGAADRILLEAVAERLLLEDFFATAHILELGGAARFGDVIRLLGSSGFDVPSSGLCDEDHAVRWAEALDIDVDALEPYGFRIARVDLEAEYVRALGWQRVVELLGAAGTNEADIVASCGVAGATDLHDELVAQFCRHDRRKVNSAIAVASGMQVDDAERLEILTAVASHAVA